MRERHYYRLVHAQARSAAADMCLKAPDGWVAQVSEPNRSLMQNSAQWPILEAFARQMQWPINGAMCWLTPEEWKDVLTAAFSNETQRIAPGLNGGMVLLGQRTSEFGKKQFSDWLEFLHAVAVDRGVSLARGAEFWLSARSVEPNIRNGA